MRALLRTVRGMLGLGTVGAVAGGSLLAVLAIIIQLIDGPISLSFVGYTFMAGAGLGLATGTVFGAGLATIWRGRRLEELSLLRAATMAGILGALLPPILRIIGGDAVPLVASEAPAIVICGLFGAFLGGGLVAVGKAGRLQELGPGHEVGSGLPGSETNGGQVSRGEGAVP